MYRRFFFFRSSLLRWWLGLFFLSLSLSLFARQHDVWVRDHGILPDGKDIAPQLNALLQRLKAEIPKGDALRLHFDKGVYHFRAAQAPEKEVYISNHDQVGKRRIGLWVEEMEHLSMVGKKGCEWRFYDAMLPLALVRSKGVRLENITLDFEETPITQVSIVRNEGKGGIFFRPAPWVKWRINGEGRFESYGTNWQRVPHSGIVFDAKTGRTAYRISDLSYSTAGTKAVGEGVLHAPAWQDDRLQGGMVVAMRTYYRPQPAIFVDGCEDVRCEKVTIHYADGMGFLVQNTHNVSLAACEVRRRPVGKGQVQRYYTTQADATHFSGCSGRVEVVDGVFEGMMDDAINVHGFYLKLTRRIDDRTVEARYMHNQAYGFEWGRVGDTVQIVYSQTFDALPQRFVLADIRPVDRVDGVGAKLYRLRFSEALPEEVKPETSIGLENMRKCPSVLFSGNVVRYNRARGALFNTPQSVEVSRNRFQYVSGAAIVASTDCNQWFESGQTQDLHIHHNIFENVLTSLYQFTEAVITLHPVIPRLEAQQTPFYGKSPCGIVIENNVFQTFDTPLLYAKSVQGLCWRKNTVKRTTSYPKFHWNQSPFTAIGCRDIRIEEE